MKMHAPKRYSCVTCSASFGLHRDLTRHEKACRRRILCATCRVAFSTRDDLKSHCQLTQHEEFVYLITDIIYSFLVFKCQLLCFCLLARICANLTEKCLHCLNMVNNIIFNYIHLFLFIIPFISFLASSVQLCNCSSFTRIMSVSVCVYC